MATVESAYTLADYVSLLKRRRRYLLTVFPAAVLLSLFLAYWLPPLYESTATILIEESTIPTTMVQTTVASDLDQQLEMVKRRALAKDDLLKLVAKVDPYPDEPDMTPGDKAAEISGSTSLEKVDPITFKPMVNGSAFTIHYLNPDPQLAKAVTAELAQLFLDYNRETRTAAADLTYRFLLEKSKQVDTEIRAVDQKIAEFKRRYGDALPEDRIRNEVAIERTKGTIDQLDGRIRDAEQREEELSLQLSQMSPTLVGAVSDWRTELANLKAQLATAEQKYTPDHPDVKRLRRAVAEMAARGSPADSNMPPDNPEYLRVKQALSAARRDAAALRDQLARARGEMASAQTHLAMTPTVEREYQQLERQQDSARAQFADLRDKLHAAEVARTLESEQQGERYTLIRPPSLPRSPSSPNRLGLVLMGFVLGGGLAIGMAALAESSDQTVRSYHDVRVVTSVPMIGAIPVLLNPDDARRRKMLVGGYAAAFGVALLIVGITVARADVSEVAAGPSASLPIRGMLR